MNEELGKDNEWGTPALTRKMLKVTPGQKRFKDFLRKEDVELVRYNSTLNPMAWDGDKKLKPDVHKALLNIAHKFMSTWSFSMPVEDIILTGSNANYNWNQHSDFDLHIIVNMKNAPYASEQMLKDYFQTKKNIWNKVHHITIRGYDVELYVQDVDDELVATGIYSLLSNHWINEPVYNKPEIDQLVIQDRVNVLKQEIDTVVQSQDLEQLTQMLDKIATMRRAGLQTGGEYNVDNLAFKVLRNMGEIQKLRDMVDAQLDKTLSVNDFNQMYQEAFMLTFKEFLNEDAPAWQRKEGKSESGGLNKKGIASYRRENPGSKLSMAVTTKPSKLKAGSKAAKRRKSFCSRMSGMKKKLTSSKTARDPDSRINKALRKWNC
jgi:hypothetical protein